jgi:hypothetical protein
MTVTRIASHDRLAHMADNIRQLVDHYQHAEPYHTWSASRHRIIQRHTAWHPPLLEQLHQASIGYDEPNLDAIDRYRQIIRAVHDWKRRLGLPARTSLYDDIRGLVGGAGEREEPVACAVATWHRWCRLLAGWEDPPWRPHAPCPQCDDFPGQRDGHPTGLRVRLDQQTAICLTCEAYWDVATIGILAEHIRLFTDTKDATRA